jgi:histidine triad (HIT) family protein
MNEKKDCIFCQIISRKLPAEIVFESEKIIAFKDINPSAPVHILVVPKKHIKNLSEVKEEDKEILGEIQLVLSNLAKKFKIEDAFKVSVNNGKEADQVIFHLHYHLMGKFKS